MRMLSLKLLFLTALLGISTTAQALTVTYSTGYGSAPYSPLVQPDWNVTLQLPRFSNALGTLTAVTITNRGEILGSIGVENKHLTLTRTIDASLAAALDATLPGGYVVTSNPVSAQTATLPLFDGIVDYAGTSGTTFTNLSAFDTHVTFVNASDLALFTGLGFLNVPVVATDKSSATGGGNTASNFSNAAGIILSIQYDYNPAPVPEPASMILFGTGLSGIAFLRRKMNKG